MTDIPAALVTGASRGIGAATALELARHGHHVALVGRDVEQLANTARQVEAGGGEALTLAGDLADLTFVESCISLVVERWGRIDVLVNNAAWREVATMRTIGVESWERTVRVCLTTPAFLARWAAEDMQRRKTGVIINVSSMMSRQAAGISPAYVACKGALDSLTCELASLYGPVGIRVLAINPGAIDTDMSRDYPSSDTAAHPVDPVRQFSEDMIMLRRWGTPEEIARVITWMASDAASYMTGTTVLVDGGWRHQHFPHSLKHQQFPHEFL